MTLPTTCNSPMLILVVTCICSMATAVHRQSQVAPDDAMAAAAARSLYRAGLDPATLAAAGVDGTEAEAMLGLLAGDEASRIQDLNTAHASLQDALIQHRDAVRELRSANREALPSRREVVRTAVAAIAAARQVVADRESGLFEAAAAEILPAEDTARLRLLVAARTDPGTLPPSLRLGVQTASEAYALELARARVAARAVRGEAPAPADAALIQSVLDRPGVLAATEREAQVADLLRATFEAAAGPATTPERRRATTPSVPVPLDRDSVRAVVRARSGR